MEIIIKNSSEALLSTDVNHDDYLDLIIQVAYVSDRVGRPE